MRSASRLVIVALLGVFLALPAVSALSALPASAQPVVRAADDEGAVVAPPATSTVQPGPGKLTPDTEADEAESKRKLIMGVASVVLVGIVIWGRSIRRKRKKATEGG